MHFSECPTVRRWVATTDAASAAVEETKLSGFSPSVPLLLLDPPQGHQRKRTHHRVPCPPIVPSPSPRRRGMRACLTVGRAARERCPALSKRPKRDPQT